MTEFIACPTHQIIIIKKKNKKGKTGEDRLAIDRLIFELTPGHHQGAWCFRGSYNSYMCISFGLPKPLE